MFLTTAATVGLLAWIVLWSIGAKAIDAFLLTVLIIVVATTIKLMLPAFPSHRRSDD
ncbi:MAG: hypothetical protein IRZ32_01420 [Solirubrobacteraceae bacterium]|nr:hypothetical protein [Solirubrobacteraceae bacterium]